MGALDTASKIAFGLLLQTVFAAISIATPLLLIWSLNTLGVASASYGVVEWVAALVLTTLLLAD